MAVAEESQTVYPCPICGRSTGRKGAPFTDPTQTSAHISGAHDEDHDGEMGNDHLDEIRENSIEAHPDELKNEAPGVTEPVVEIDGEEMLVSEAVEYLHGFVQSARDSSVSDQEVQSLRNEIDALREGQSGASDLITANSDRLDELDDSLTKLAKVVYNIGSDVDGVDETELLMEMREEGLID